MTAEWTLGECPAAVHAHGVAVLAPGQDEIARQLWDLLEKRTEFTTVVQVLTSQFGADLQALPDFAILVREGEGMRLAVRGMFAAQVRVGQALTEVSGGTLLTWSEHRFDAVDAWHIAIDRDDEDEQPIRGRGLVRDAVVLVDSLRFGDVTVDTDEAASALEAALAALHAKSTRRAERETHQADDVEAVDEESVEDVVSLDEPVVEDVAESDERVESEPVELVADLEDTVVEVQSESAAAEAQEADSDDDTIPDAELDSDEPAEPVASDDALNENTIYIADLSSEFPEVSADEVADDEAPAEEPAEEPVAEEESVQDEPASVGEERPDYHDGYTVNLSMAAHQSNAKVHVLPANEGAASEGRKVLAVPCVDGHPNPPYVQACRVCGKEMRQTLIHVDRPSLGRLILSTGEAIELDRDIVIGRSPKDLRRAGRADVRLISVESEDQNISRTHCEIRVDGWEARVRDLGSQNGTFLTHVGQDSRRIEQAKPEVLNCGDVITLADSFSIRLEC